MFKSKSMVIFYGETWSILQTTWLNCSKVEQATRQDRLNRTFFGKLLLTVCGLVVYRSVV